AKSIEILTHRTKAPEMNFASLSELYTSAPSLKTSFISVWYFWNAPIIASADQINIPAFQRKSPLCRNVVASSRFGFSVNVFTFLNPFTCALWPYWIYPYPVSGREGLMPNVISQSFPAAHSSPLL